MQMKSQRRYRTFLIVLVYLVAAIYSIGLGISSEVRQRDLLYSFIIAFFYLHKSVSLIVESMENPCLQIPFGWS